MIYTSESMIEWTVAIANLLCTRVHISAPLRMRGAKVCLESRATKLRDGLCRQGGEFRENSGKSRTIGNSEKKQSHLASEDLQHKTITLIHLYMHTRTHMLAKLP